MGILEARESGERVHLLSDTRVGRGPEHHLALTARSVSSPHASVRWDGAAWVVRDLGSRNGTFVDDRRLTEGERARLHMGCVLRFGGDRPSFRLVDASGPQAIATDLGSGRRRAARNGLLVLPTDTEPLVSVFEGPNGKWIAERDNDTRTVADREVITVRGQSFRLSLPHAHPTTWEATRPVPTLETIELRFGVSSDEEHVVVAMVHGEEVAEMPPRSFHYLLLTLARARLDEADLPIAERGWVERDALCKMLLTDPTKLNVDIYRARKQLAELGVIGATGIIERRASTRALRLGVEALTVRRL